VTKQKKQQMSYVLHIRVIEARDIAKMDTFGKSDPYVLVQLKGGKVFRTKVIDNTLKPVWNETFSMPITDMGATLYLLMKDRDVSADDEMSRLEISLTSIKPGDVLDQWFPMRPVKGVKKGGEIHLQIHIAQPGEAPFVQKKKVAAQPMMYPQGQPMMYPQGQPMMYPQGQPMMQPGMYPQGQPMMQQPGMYPQGQPMMQPGMYPQGQPMMQPGMYPQGQPMMQQPGMYPQSQPGMYPGPR
jgi:hypothetical protein